MGLSLSMLKDPERSPICGFIPSGINSIGVEGVLDSKLPDKFDNLSNISDYLL